MVSERRASSWVKVTPYEAVGASYKNSQSPSIKSNNGKEAGQMRRTAYEDEWDILGVADLVNALGVVRTQVTDHLAVIKLHLLY